MPVLPGLCKEEFMVKAKNMMYVQSFEYLPYKDLEDCLEHIETQLKPIRYAGIVHDKDMNDDGTLKPPHIHVMLQFENARSTDNVARLLKDSPQYLEKWNGDSTNGYSYLIHETSNAKDQYQYDIDEVTANFDFKALIEHVRNGAKRMPSKDEVLIKAYLDLLYTGEISKEEIELKLSGSQYAKAKTRIENVYQKRLEHYVQDWQKKMNDEKRMIEVIWIFGNAGVGKTRLAKMFAQTLTDKVFFSGSSRDPFQKYNLEEVIILDELRFDTFSYADLLKMFDPFNNDAMGASRYYDKPLVAHTFIITSPYKPELFYSKMIASNKNLDSRIDSFKQLARRIGLVLSISKQFLEAAFYDEDEDQFILEKSTRELNPFLEEFGGEEVLRNERTEKVYKSVIDSFSKRNVIKPTKAEDDAPKDN